MALVSVGLGITVASPAATGRAAPKAAAVAPTVKSVGHLEVGAARVVDIAALPNTAVTAQSTSTRTSLRRDGTPSARWKSATNAPTVAKPAVAAPQALTEPTHVRRNWVGTQLSNSSCGCQPPDVNMAAGSKHLVEAVNLSLAIYTKKSPPALVSRKALSTFLGTGDGLSDPRVMWDPTWSRFSLVLTDTSSPSLWLAYSSSSDATKPWYVYHVGLPLVAGSIADYPMVGQTQDAYLYTSNNFDPSDNYINSTAFTAPKARVYNGFGWGSGLAGVAFNTSPVTLSGVPLDNSDPNGYLAAPDDANNVIYLYTVSNASTAASFTFAGSISYNWAAPPRRVNQPGTSQTLDPLDGRFDWPPMLVNGRIYFAHGVAIGSFPGIDYGFFNTDRSGLTVSTVFHSATSDDFNPSIAAYPDPAGSGSEYVYVNWAYTDTPAGVPTSMSFSGLSPGDGVQHLAGTTLVTGASTTEFRFGDYSSVAITPYAITPTCGTGQSAFIANEIFNANGTWTTRLANIAFC